MLPQNIFPGGFIVCAARVVGVQQVIHESEVVRKTLIGTEIQAQIELRPNETVAPDDIAEIGYEIAALEYLYDLIGELLECVGTLVAQIEAREFVVPRAIRKLPNGALIDFLLLLIHLVLCQELREALVETGIVRVAVYFAAKHLERARKLLQGGEASEVALEHARIF